MAVYDSPNTWQCTTAPTHGSVRQPQHMAVYDSPKTWQCTTAPTHGSVRQPQHMAVYDSPNTWQCTTAPTHGSVRQPQHMAVSARFSSYWYTVTQHHLPHSGRWGSSASEDIPSMRRKTLIPNLPCLAAYLATGKARAWGSTP
ncbi:uncharacterized protein LOC143282539 [Babylonia areolata]|uniref:uncharacterized protein LOC143282539 n=1 Tax=Babylonia areolata TaxID=304850 RepID=UPI003FD06BD8